MLSFELSVIDVVLIIAVAILLSFHITPKKTNVKSKSSGEMEKSLEKGKMRNSGSRTPKTKSSFAEEESPVKCSYHFGYLSSVPKEEDSIPEECYGCSRMMLCLFSKGKKNGDISA